MKAFLPFLLLPALGLGGWWMADQVAVDPNMDLPVAVKLDAPPALGVVIPVSVGSGPVRVNMDALLPPLVKAAPTAKQIYRFRETTAPSVQAILVDGSRRVVQVNGQALNQGDSYGAFRVAAIEPDRVRFEHPALRQALWVSVSDQ